MILQGWNSGIRREIIFRLEAVVALLFLVGKNGEVLLDAFFCFGAGWATVSRCRSSNVEDSAGDGAGKEKSAAISMPSSASRCW